MNTKLALKNFRVFDNKQGGTFNLAPITILTGCNSSGKSSLVKALLLLKDFFKDLATNKIIDCKLDFGNKLAKLGRFDVVRNKNSRKGSKITFEYTTRSIEMDCDLRVRMSFEADNEDVLNNGYLSNVLIAKNDNDGSNKVILDLCKNNQEENNPCYEIRKINLNPICFAFIKYSLKKLILTRAHNTYPSGADNNFKDEDIKGLNELLSTYRLYCADVEEFNKFVKKVQERLGAIELYGPDTSRTVVLRQIVGVHTNVLLFDLPIFGWLNGVSKYDVRRVIDDKINESSSDSKQFQYSQYLNAILDAFEKSKYETFVEYFKAQENEALIFRNILGDDFRSPLWISWNGANGLEKISNISDAIAYDPYYRGKELCFSIILNTLIDVCKFTIPSFWKDEMEERWLRENSIYEYKLFAQMREFYHNIVCQVLSPIDFRNFEYVGDSNISIQRIYSAERNDEFGKVLYGYLDACLQNEWADINNGDFINKWIKRFGLGDHISISHTTDGLGIIMKIHKTPNDKQGVLLADEGFGITKLIGTMINIETAILKAKRNHLTGYGVIIGKKQRYPKIARAHTTLAIEEPENHLHPRYQSLLAEMFADAYKNYGIHFIVETHSEYMVRKLQTLVAKKELTPAEVSLQYLYNPDVEQRPKGEPQVKNIPIREDGILEEPFGPGFLDEADNLAMDILTIKAMS